MTAIRADTVLAEVAELDGEDRRTTNIVWNLGMLRSILHDVLPREAEEVAAYVYALLEREPVKGQAHYAPHRMILGSLASELRTYARDAGEPVGLWADLRDAQSQSEERRILQRLDEQAIAFSAYTDDVIAATNAQRVVDAARVDTPEPPPEEPVSDPAPPVESDDDFVLP